MNAQSAQSASSEHLNATLWEALLASDSDPAEWARAASALADGANIESINDLGLTPFRFFAGEGRLTQARWLASRGAQINAVDRLGTTALHQAVTANEPARAKALLEMGLDADARSSSGATALLLAVLAREPESMTRVFLSHGVNPNTCSTSGTSPILAAAASTPSLVLELLEAGADSSQVDLYGQGLLHALLGHPEGESHVRQIMDRDPSIDVNHASKSGTTPLGLAAERHQTEAITVLLDCGADPNARSANRFGERPTALMVLAAVEQDPKLPTLRAALRAGASVTMCDDAGRNAAWYAITHSHGMSSSVEPEAGSPELPPRLRQIQSVLGLLIDAGLSPSAPLDPSGFSPLHLALMALPKGPQRQRWIDWSLTAGFPADPPRSLAPIAPSAASRRGYVQESSESGGTALSPLLLALVSRDLDSMRQLLTAGAQPFSDRPNEVSALHAIPRLVVASQAEAAAEALVLQQVSARSDDSEQSQAAQAKARAQIEKAHADLAAFRLEALNALAFPTSSAPVGGASAPAMSSVINARNDRGRTPLMDYVEAGDIALVDRALALGADPWSVDPAGDTALSLALHHGHIALAHALLRVLPAPPPEVSSFSTLLLDLALSSPEAIAPRDAFVHAMHSLSDEPSRAAWLAATDASGNTPLIIAAATAQDDLVDLFLSMGADPNAQSLDGNTALHHAIVQGSTPIISLLRRHGARSDQPNGAGNTALQVALECRKHFLVAAVTQPNLEPPVPWPLHDEVASERTRGRALWPARSSGPLSSLQSLSDPPAPSTRKRSALK